MNEKSKHKSTLNYLRSNFAVFLKSCLRNALPHTLELEEENLFTQFMHLAIFTSAQQLRLLKKELSQEATCDDYESYETLDALSRKNPSAGPNMILALDVYRDTFPKYLKDAMFRSGFHTTEMKESHASYTSLYSSFIASQTKNLNRLYSTLPLLKSKQKLENKAFGDSSAYYNITTSSLQTEAVSDHQKNLSEKIQLFKKTKRHFIYHDRCKNVAIKVLISDMPSIKEVENHENECKIIDQIRHPAFRNVLAKTIFKSKKALTLEWADGCALSELVHSFSIKDFLEVAREIISALLAMHEKKIMHVNLNCDHIIFNHETRSVKIIGFGSSSNFNSKRHHLSDHELLEKDLRHISPEQIGIVNREVDFRSDFYSVGIVFYKMLTGKYPFEDDDASKLLNLHIFQEPLPVCSINPKIPISISMMISTLMKKYAEERYQSAKGLIYDLDLMLSEYQPNGNLTSFALKQNDIPQTLLMPQKLYGRRAEFDVLSSVVNRTNTSSFELVFVTGKVGSGKSSLVYELCKSVFRRNGFFICGKHDLKISEPYFAMLEAMKSLCNEILLRDKVITSKFKSQIIDALGQEAKILTDVMRNLHLIIGHQPSAPDTYGQEAKNQFNYVFTKFIKAVCSGGFPIVLVLEDLQWMDIETLNLVSTLIKNKSIENLTIICSYRDNKVNEEHPVSELLKNARRSGINTTNINLDNFNHETVNEFISHTVCAPSLDTYSLTVLIYEKTKGNPFFVSLMLKSLFEEGHLFFCHDSNKWRWNISASIENKITENVLELLRLKILAMDGQTQQALKTASCLGSPFSLKTLKLIVNSNRGIEGALNSEIIIQYKGSDTIYCFAHDQIQQAAFSLLPNNPKEIFLYIGKKLWRLSSNSDIDEIVFVVANLLHNSADIITDKIERLDMARIFLIAGEKAMKLTAFRESFAYLNTGIALLGPEGWKTHYDLALKLHDTNAKAAFSAGKYSEMNKTIYTILDNAVSALHCINIFSLKIKFYNDDRRFEDAIHTAQVALDNIGAGICFNQATPSDINRTKNLIIGISDEEICEMKTIDNQVVSATLRILGSILGSCHFVNPMLNDIITATIVQLTFHHGLSKFSSFGFTSFGVCICKRGDNLGYRFGRLGLKLADKHEAKEITPWVINSFHFMISPYHCCIHNSVNQFYRAFKIGLEIGSFYTSSVSATSHIVFGFITGMHLPKLAKYCQEFNDVLPLKGLMYSAVCQAVFNLLSVDKYRVLKGEEFDFNCCFYQIKKPFEVARALIFCCMYAYLFNDYPSASTFLNAFRPLSSYISRIGGILHPMSIFYDCLISLVDTVELTSNKKELILEQVRINISKLRKLSENAPTNFLNKVYFLEAEMAAVHGDVSQAIKKYEEAISASKKNGFRNEEAMACERSGMFFLSLGSSSNASQSLLKSYRCYEDWGAKAKLDQLNKRYPTIFTKFRGCSINVSASIPIEESLASISMISEETSTDMLMN